MNVWLRRAFPAVLIVLLTACAGQPHTPAPPKTVDGIARLYVQLELTLNRLHPGELIYDNAPADLHAAAAASTMSIRDISLQAQQAIIDLHTLPPDAHKQRHLVLENQLAALTARTGMLHGWKPAYDDEIRALYDVQPLSYDSLDVDAILNQLDRLLPRDPGAGLAERYTTFLRRYAVSGARLKSAFHTVLTVARDRSAAQLQLPADEQLDLVLRSDDDTASAWESREQYLGHGHSRLQLNTADNITLARVIELVAREAYPGWHAGDSLRQQSLVEDRGWIEYSVLPRYSPQAFIAEGRARAGVDLVFPPQHRIELERHLFSEAGFDPRQAVVYDRIWRLGQRLQPIIYRAARAYCTGSQTVTQTLTTLQRRALLTSAQAAAWITRIDRQRSAAVIGILAQSVVAKELRRAASSTPPHTGRLWQAYARLSAVPSTPYQLQRSGTNEQ